MENEKTMVDIPVTARGLQNLCSEVFTCRKDEIIALHKGIPANQMLSIVRSIVDETVEQLVSATKDTDNE